MHFPNESAQYRQARNALLAEEIEFRRHIERVALADLFGDKQTLVVYCYMFGPQREQPCPMCTSLLSAWDGEAFGAASSSTRM